MAELVDDRKKKKFLFVFFPFSRVEILFVATRFSSYLRFILDPDNGPLLRFSKIFYYFFLSTFLPSNTNSSPTFLHSQFYHIKNIIFHF